MIKLYLRAGHGGAHIGTSGHGLIEKHEALRHILAIAKLLAEYDVELKLARTTDVTVQLSASIGEANQWGANLYYSGHHNGFFDSKAHGYESYIFTSPSVESMRVQNVMHPKQAAVWVKWGSRNRGKKRANFAELRETKMASILIENGFMTNHNDARLLKNTNFLQKLDQATVDGFVALYLLKLKGEPDLKAKTYIVRRSDNMITIARNNNMTLNGLLLINSHIKDPGLIEVGDIIFLTQPSTFEIEYATMNRELLLCRKLIREYKETGKQINMLSEKFMK